MIKDFKTGTLYRVLTGIVALPVYFFALAADYFNSILILIVSLAISLVTLYEYYKLCDKDEDGKPFIVWGMIAGTVANIIIFYFAFGEKFGFFYSSIFQVKIILAFIALFLGIILVIQLFGRPIKGGIYSLAVTVFGIIYIVFFFSHIILMKAMQDGFLYILMLNIIIMINDTAAYFGGSLFGKHKLNFPVSPNKSWEGYFSGLVFSIIFMIVTNEIYGVFLNKHLFSLIECIIVAAFLSTLGHLGDLVESAVKRDASKKDSGALLPGHGGMWDVFDALIFSLPFFYYYLIIKGVS
jgi:phosphatidate cytidylyltransferase